MQKNKISSAFTLVEILLVIAIIGILAGIVFAMIGNSDNSKRKAVISTAKSIMPYSQECLFKGIDLDTPTDNQLGGGALCLGSVTSWPKIGIEGCLYSGISANKYSIDCSSEMDSLAFICCDSQSGSCVEANICP